MRYRETNIRRLSMAISTAVILVIAVGIIAKFWLIPATIRKGIISEINKSWPEHVYIKELRFYFKGHVTLSRLLLKDNEGRNVLQLKNVKAFLPDISRLNFKVKSLDITSVDIDVFPPLSARPAEKPGTKPGSFSEKFSWLNSGHFAIKQINIENISITLHNTREDKVIYEDLQLYINKLSNLYNILFTKPSALESQVFKLEGTWDPYTEKSDFELLLKHYFRSEDTAILSGFPGIDPSYKYEGFLDAAVRLSQNPGELDPTGLNGTIEFDNWKVSRNENTLLKNLRTKVILDSNQCKTEDLRADICQGTLEGSLIINNWTKRSESSCTGRIAGKKLDLTQLSKCLDIPKKLSKGTLSFEYGLIRNDNDLRKFEGEGFVFIDNSDMYQLPVISKVFASVGVKTSNFQKATDAMLLFRNTGSVVTINKGQIANRFWAIRVEPGGTVDIQDKTVDMHVVVIPLSLVEDILRKLPFAELFGRVKDKLARLKVKGRWSDPDDKLVTKEPLTDIKETTINFIRDIVDSGGQITEKMRKPFKGKLDNQNLQKQ